MPLDPLAKRFLTMMAAAAPGDRLRPTADDRRQALAKLMQFARADVSSVRKLGFAGAPMTEALLRELDTAFRPALFVNHYGSSEVYTFTIEQNAGQAGLGGSRRPQPANPGGTARRAVAR